MAAKQDKSFQLHVRVHECKNLLAADANGLSDPYVKLRLHADGDEKGEKQKTKTIKESLHPVYEQDFTFSKATKQHGLEVSVFDQDRASKNDPLGDVKIPLDNVASEGITQWYPLRIGETSFGTILLTLVKDKTPPAKKEKEVAAAAKLKLDEVVSRYLKGPAVDAAVDEKDEEAGNLRVFCGSWNVGNAPPEAAQIRKWISRNHDIYAIGAQECNYKVAGKSCEKDWEDTVVSRFGEEFVLIKATHLMEIRLLIFARANIVWRIHSVVTKSEATGVANVVGNKGGTVCVLTVDNATYCFVNSHLAAHQDQAPRRNADVAEIIAGTRMGRHKLDMMHQFHHVFLDG